MGIAIPTSINTAFKRGSFSEVPVDDVIRTSMDVGTVKTRPRSTRVRYKLTGTIYLTSSQYLSWRTFYDETLIAGSQAIEFTHPISGITGDYNIMAPPSVTDGGANSYNLTLELQEV